MAKVKGSLASNNNDAESAKLLAVICAVGDQLHSDHHPLDPGKNMGSDFGYLSELIQGFLGGVRGRLAWHNPPYDFSFDSLFGDKATSLSVGALIDKINRKTSLRGLM